MNRTAMILGLGCLLIPALAQMGRAPGRSSYPGAGVSRGRQAGAAKGPTADEPLPNFTGVLRGGAGKSLTLEDSATNTLLFASTRKTRYYEGSKSILPSALKPGDHLSIEARQAPDGSLIAVRVHREAKQQ